MNWTLGILSTAVYAACFAVVGLFALNGHVGSVDLTSVIGWILTGWLACYTTILVLLVSGTARWIFITCTDQVDP